MLLGRLTLPPNGSRGENGINPCLVLSRSVLGGGSASAGTDVGWAVATGFLRENIANMLLRGASCGIMPRKDLLAVGHAGITSPFSTAPSPETPFCMLGGGTLVPQPHSAPT